MPVTADGRHGGRQAGLALTAVFLTVLGGLAWGQGSASAPSRPRSLQCSPLGLLLGSYLVGAEYLAWGAHGLYVEGSWADRRDGDGNGAKATQYCVNYRYHLKRRPDSNFVGLFLRRSTVQGALEVDDESYPFGFTAASAGALYGSCHVWRSGICLTWRLGLGVPYLDFAWSADRPPHHGLYEGIFRWTAGLESGLTAGYSF